MDKNGYRRHDMTREFAHREATPDVTVRNAAMIVIVLSFLTLGLWTIGIVWQFSEAEKLVERIPTEGGTIVIEDADASDLPLQAPSNVCIQGTCGEVVQSL